MNDEPERQDSERYAQGLWLGVRVALIGLVSAFVCYLTGWIAPAVPLERLPDLWGLPVGEYLRRAGMPYGWSWLRLGTAEGWLTASVALLLSVSTLCLVPLVTIYARRRDWPFLVITLALIAVLAVAAGGVFTLKLHARFWV